MPQRIEGSVTPDKSGTAPGHVAAGPHLPTVRHLLAPGEDTRGLADLVIAGPTTCRLRPAIRIAGYYPKLRS